MNIGKNKVIYPKKIFFIFYFCEEIELIILFDINLFSLSLYLNRNRVAGMCLCLYLIQIFSEKSEISERKESAKRVIKNMLTNHD